MLDDLNLYIFQGLFLIPILNNLRRPFLANNYLNLTPKHLNKYAKIYELKVKDLKLVAKSILFMVKNCL